MLLSEAVGFMETPIALGDALSGIGVGLVLAIGFLVLVLALSGGGKKADKK